MSAMEAVPTSEFRLELARNTTVDLFVAMEPFLDRHPFWSEEYGGYWVVTRYEHVREVLQDAATFSSVDMMVPPVERGDGGLTVGHRSAGRKGRESRTAESCLSNCGDAEGSVPTAAPGLPDS